MKTNKFFSALLGFVGFKNGRSNRESGFGINCSPIGQVKESRVPDSDAKKLILPSVVGLVT